jgi:hypothetical protein
MVLQSSVPGIAAAVHEELAEPPTRTPTQLGQTHHHGSDGRRAPTLMALRITPSLGFMCRCLPVDVSKWCVLLVAVVHRSSELRSAAPVACCSLEPACAGAAPILVCREKRPHRVGAVSRVGETVRR